MSTARNRDDLLIDRLEIRDFRQYEHLTIDRLARVNLIVGRNGAGKTSVLEAIRILATIGAPHVLWDIVASRDEQGLLTSPSEDVFRQHGFINLFRRGTTRLQMSIESSHRQLRTEFAWYREIWDGEQFVRIEKVASGPDARTFELGMTEGDPVSLRPLLEVKTNGTQRRIQLGRRYTRPAPDVGGEYHCMYVGSAGINAA